MKPTYKVEYEDVNGNGLYTYVKAVDEDDAVKVTKETKDVAYILNVNKVTG